MARLARQLESIPDLGYALYANDITLWLNRGSLGHKEQTLPEAAQTVHLCGELWYELLAGKWEFVRVHGKGHRGKQPFHLRVGDHPIREVAKARILGLRGQCNRQADHTLRILRTTVRQIASMLYRVTYQCKGFGKAHTLRLIIHTFVISRVTTGLI
ncbi:hypothetical protein HPB49_016375 [Dermacentor silvarum]|uniref:Uncharacterized protein n=1 Tax=Dermacentor silvarum TaxID=543639 RepID=A0ACB8DPB0_DERSI|nr:hypothetical protein HPB49_016375 [Dermacentor silvarum]